MLLSTLPPSRGQERLALVAALLLLAVFLVTLPFAHIRLGRIDVFIPIVATVMFLNDTITSVLLFAQFAVLRALALLVLATGYLFTGLLMIPYVLTFPGAFSPTGWLGAGLQSTGWLFISWHMGLPAIAIAYALLKDREPARQVASASVRATMVASIVGVLCGVVGMTWLVTVHHDVLPAVMRDVIETNPVWNYVVAPGMLLLCVIAIALLWARRRSLLDLWLLAVAWAWLLDAILLNLVDYRFTVAWYANRVFAISSATFVLAVLLSETTMMYARLALSVMAQRRERESRIMTVDAVAASIAHEINQPLAAIVNNGGAGLRWLARGAPDVDKASEALKAIVNDGHRASQVIAGIRATFKRDRPEKERLDINGVINEALVLTRSDLQDHGIVVDTELDAKLPAISANKVQLQQVLLNLIANASEAMDAVTSRARLLRIRTQRHGENEVLVAVEDAGPGIDPQDGGRMFDAFVTTKSGGMGLGLPICRSIIDAHGGRLWATPGIAYGSAFQFVLPARDPGEA